MPNKFIIPNAAWENVIEPVHAINLNQTVKDILVHKRHYTDTEQWKNMIATVEAFAAGKINQPSKHGAYWCRSREDVIRYFEILLDCCDSIRNNSYMTQQQLSQTHGMLNSGGVVRRIDDEIEVLIDRTGELVFSGIGGNHRFAIIQTLNTLRVPVILGGIDAIYAESIYNGRIMSSCKIYEKCVLAHPSLEFMDEQCCTSNGTPYE